MKKNHLFQEENQSIWLPHSFPVYAIHAKAERLSAALFKWLKKSVRLPSVNEFAFMITSFNGLRNSANPARSGFCSIGSKHLTSHQSFHGENKYTALDSLKEDNPLEISISTKEISCPIFLDLS